MEIWIDGHPEKYRLEAKNKKLKEEFAAELKKNILKAKENPSTSRTARQPQAVQEENITSASDSEPRKDKRRPSFNRSKSLDQEVQRKLDRQQSSDTETRVATGQGWGRAEANGHLPHRSRSETHLTEKNIDRYLVLADYDPLSDRELGLRQMDQVDLLKTGCAGWWFVQLVRPPYSQGWAPSTYLQQLDEWEK